MQTLHHYFELIIYVKTGCAFICFRGFVEEKPFSGRSGSVYGVEVTSLSLSR